MNDKPPPALEIGQSHSLFIREERLSSQLDSCRLMYVSDIHLRQNRSERICHQVIEAVRSCEIDAILLGGDLVDAASELGILSSMVSGLRNSAPILAIGGNHDEWVGLNRVRDAVVAGGGQWIHGDNAILSHQGRKISITGPESSFLPDADIRILCAHNPRIWKTARHRGYDLVLAGHLHGCQVVAWEYRDRLYPGAIVYPYCYLSHQVGSTRLIVSRGVSDLIPIRWRCPREVVLCYV